MQEDTLRQAICLSAENDDTRVAIESPDECSKICHL
jgi:hypothetical protein